MQIVNVVPNKITETLYNLRPLTYRHGAKIATEDLHHFSPDFMNSLYLAYRKEYGWKYRTMVIPKILSIIYRVILTIPEIKQLASVAHNDYAFANKALGFPTTYSYDYVRKCGQQRTHPYVGFAGLNEIYNELSVIESQGKHLSTALHNLSDELDCKKITFKGLIPSVWVAYYRKPQQTISNDEFDAIRANNTGIDVVDDITRNIDLDIRSDIRQDAALHCLQIGLGKLTNDQIANIVNSIYRKYRNKEIAKSYEERSLFAKPYGNEGPEMWQVLASTI